MHDRPMVAGMAEAMGAHRDAPRSPLEPRTRRRCSPHPSRRSRAGSRRSPERSSPLGGSKLLLDALDEAIQAFLEDRRAAGRAAGTVAFYREKLGIFQRFLSEQGIRRITGITPSVLRSYLLALADGHTPGGVHGAYRAVRALLRWWEEEVEPVGWTNPLRKVRAPKVPVEYLEPVPLADVRAMLDTCDPDTFPGRRDRAILLALLDTGCRAREFLAISQGDVSMEAGDAIVRSGKGRKPRTVFVGQTARQALSAYLAHLPKEATAPLWLTEQGTALTYSGLREIMRRRSRRAGIQAPPLHAFRRAFALGCLRGGVDVYSLQRLMGHSNLTVLRRYLELTVDDLRRAHAASAPADSLVNGAG